MTLPPLACAIAVIIVASVHLAMSDAPCDALCHRVRTELAVYTDWLDRGNVRGYIGEVGWPDDTHGDGASWNALARRWFEDADERGLPVTTWATGSRWGTSYRLAGYEDRSTPSGVDSPNTQAAVTEVHPSASAYDRGVNVAGGEFGAPSIAPTSTFSNANPGGGSEHGFDPDATFTYLASRGVRIVRIPFRWERVQRTPGGPLDDASVAQLRDAVARAHAAGLRVIIDMHNYSAYYLSDGTRGVRRAVGSDEVPKAAFADVWRRLSNVFRGDPGIAAYGLMNEPVGMSAKAGFSAAHRWEIVSQAALNAIRGNGDRTMVMVAGYDWSGVQHWDRVHPRPWIVDTSGRFAYEAHHYWDAGHTGMYPRSYEQEVETARAQGF